MQKSTKFDKLDDNVEKMSKDNVAWFLPNRVRSNSTFVFFNRCVPQTSLCSVKVGGRPKDKDCNLS